jgi:hypothetical protein
MNLRHLFNRSEWGKSDYFVLSIALFLVFIYPNLPAIEGRFFPVVSKAVLISSENTPPPEYRHTWVAQAEKLRACNYVRGSLRWYLGPIGGRVAGVKADFTDAPEVRFRGALSWEGLVIDLSDDLVLSNSYATVRHQCPWRFWETESIFYLSPQD